jgi:D-lactate dehydrogenase
MNANSPRHPTTAQPALSEHLKEAVTDPARVKSAALDRLAMAHDASHFVLTPQVVVEAANAQEVGALFRVASECGLHITFRSGGTSLSGQAVTDGILLDTRRHFRAVEVLDDGARVRAQPGAVVRHVNNRLRPHRRRLGPDPASESACTLGGVIANNSSGMACGTEHNTYQTLESMVLVLPSGTVIDTSAPDADTHLERCEPALHAGLIRLRDRVRANAASTDTIRRLFSMKNTMGYGLNAFLDHSAPVKILEHLMVGSEGTLGFVAEATFRTIPDPPEVATGLLVFDDLEEATRSLPSLVATSPATIELLDATALRVAQLDPHAPALVRDLVVDRHAALLVEYQAANADQLNAATTVADRLLAELRLPTATRLTRDPKLRGDLWHLRKGLYAAVAGARPVGSTALLEDVAVPVSALLPLCLQLVDLFARSGYGESVIFGHAKDGNIHFLINEYFSDPDSQDRYQRFTEELVDLVLSHGGTLKAEHGTGRMMAPYVQRQYGDELYAVMREIKALCDPARILSPGIVVGDDDHIHLRHFKPVVSVEPEIDRCVECGYCEPVCPSQDLTTTPRQRIVLRRERSAAEARGDDALIRELDRDYPYAAVDTCAADGMCQTACPVGIDTGDLVRRLRTKRANPTESRAWNAAASRWDTATYTANKSLALASVLPPPIPRSATQLGRRLIGPEHVPLWNETLSTGPPARVTEHDSAEEPAAVLFSSCTSAIFGAANDERRGNHGAGPSLLRLCTRAGLGLVAPEGVSALCCGMPWKSKGMTRGLDVMRQRVLPILWEATDHGRLPVVCDASSCTEGLAGLVEAGTRAAPQYAALRVVDAVEYVAAEVLPRLPTVRRVPSLAIHPTCSSTRLQINAALHQIAEAVAEEVITPTEWRCCAFAGDRGLLRPELTESATRAEAAELEARDCHAHASCNRTCEVGMSQATGHPYLHIIELLEMGSR